MLFTGLEEPTDWNRESIGPDTRSWFTQRKITRYLNRRVNEGLAETKNIGTERSLEYIGKVAKKTCGDGSKTKRGNDRCRMGGDPPILYRD